ncbi:MAG: hypothetical protein H0U06_11260 [Solirubrobacterales bacterium]|nr:hypothetical protein [Solirubrobacterales bacterium]
MIDSVFVVALIAAPFIFGFSADDTATAFFVIVGRRLGARRGDPLRTGRAE